MGPFSLVDQERSAQAPTSDARERALRRGAAWLLLVGCLFLSLLERDPSTQLPAYRGLEPTIPEAAGPGPDGPRFVNLPPAYVAPLYHSPTDGELLGEWPGGTPVTALGLRFNDGRARWLLVGDPAGNEGWIAEVYLGEQVLEGAAPAAEEYLSSVAWGGEIAICINPAGGPPGFDEAAFVALVEAAAARWRAVTDDALPLVSRGRCESDPQARRDGSSTVGWSDSLGLVIAGQAWPDADRGTVSEVDILLNRGYFERLHARRPEKTMRACIYSTVMHELGHLIGLDHPRSRLLPSSMQAVGASRCDKGQPTASDRENLLRRYAPRVSE